MIFVKVYDIPNKKYIYVNVSHIVNMSDQETGSLLVVQEGPRLANISVIEKAQSIIDQVERQRKVKKHDLKNKKQKV